MSGNDEKITKDGGRVSPTSEDIPTFGIRIVQPNSQDLETGSIVSTENRFDEELVTWDGDDDPRSPYNWPLRRKLGMATILSLGSLVSTMSASMMAPALSQIGRDLGIGSSSTQLTMSIYLLALAFGPLIIGPFSEMYGRKPVWMLCNLWYILFNTICPINNSRGLMVAGRFLSGLGASVSIAIAGPVMADLWMAENRGKSFAISNFAGLFGAAIGPIVGGYVSQGVGWPWLFWTVSIFDAVLVLLSVFLVHESYAPALLAKKSKKLRKNSERNYRTVFERSHPTMVLKLRTSLYRPLHLLATRPIIHVCSLLIAYSFGVYILALSTFANIWTDIYHESISSSSLHYIAIAIGSTVASQIGGPVTDRIFLHLKSKAGGGVAPEYRVPLMIPGALLMPIGLCWYGWSAEKRVFWLVTDIGAGIFSCGVFLSVQAVLAYLIDEFAEHSASANAAARILSNVMGFAFPLFAPQLYNTLGYGWGNSLLAFLYLAIGVPAPFLLWKWGPRIRATGRPTQ